MREHLVEIGRRVAWRAVHWPLHTLAELFWILGSRALEVSLWFGDLSLATYRHIDPVGVEWRRQELLRALEEAVDERPSSQSRS